MAEISGFDYTTLVASANLVNPDLTPFTDRTEKGINKPNLIGSLHVHGERLLDLLDEPRILFVFSDLCCRYSGVFRVRFAVSDMLRFAPIDASPESGSHIVFSDVFECQSPRSYMKNLETTPLSISLNDQCLLPYRRVKT